ncbi:hypothetical protein K458DRAFT_455022 [Lentithecium fluviatile CBS 122367]|uniref:Uncharacterized protein n=1 Tax=Lentithecium fluviatile CBS 122367 TaxID=1168545 RepID=A0A6G1JJY6_9PLEO|nr:hypothetical protein K458DRAFT_455022 [Lentithecium fluviatile CBS 122367]
MLRSGILRGAAGPASGQVLGGPSPMCQEQSIRADESAGVQIRVVDQVKVSKMEALPSRSELKSKSPSSKPTSTTKNAISATNTPSIRKSLRHPFDSQRSYSPLFERLAIALQKLATGRRAGRKLSALQREEVRGTIHLAILRENMDALYMIRDRADLVRLGMLAEDLEAINHITVVTSTLRDIRRDDRTCGDLLERTIGRDEPEFLQVADLSSMQFRSI